MQVMGGRLGGLGGSLGGKAELITRGRVHDAMRPPNGENTFYLQRAHSTQRNAIAPAAPGVHKF